MIGGNVLVSSGDGQRRSGAGALLYRTAEWILSLSALALVAWVLWWSDREIDVVDESYSLLLTAHPGDSLVGGEVYFFGAVYHPLFVLVGEDVALLRRVSLLVTALLAAGAVILIHRRLRQHGSADVPFRRLLPTSAAAGMVVLTVVFGYFSPSYNSLAVQALLLVFIGLGLVSSPDRGQWAGFVLLGVGGWLAFAAKPPTGAAVAVVSVLVLLGLRRLTVRGVGLSALTATCLAIATMAGMGLSPLQVPGYLNRGLAHLNLMDSHSSVLTMIGLGRPLAPTDRFLVVGVIIASISVAGTLLLARRPAAGGPSRPVRLGQAVAAVTALTALGVAWLFHVAIATGLGFDSFGQRGLAIILLLPVPTLVVALVLARADRRAADELVSAEAEQRRQASEAGWSRRDAGVLALATLTFPWLYALGTNSPFWMQMPRAGVFYLLGGLIALSLWTRTERRAASVLVYCATAVALTWVVTSAGLPRPPRSGPLPEATVPVQVFGGTLRLGPDQAEPFMRVREVAERHGVTHDTPVIDLTGISPGYAMQLGGRPLGRAFLIGVFPGSIEAARYSIGLESCEDRSRAWLLYALASESDISPALTGVDVPEDYVVRGTFQTRNELDVQILEPTDVVAQKLGCPTSVG